MPRLAAMSRTLGHGLSWARTWPGSVGHEVTRFPPGDQVFSTTKGALAEHACAPETS